MPLKNALPQASGSESEMQNPPTPPKGIRDLLREKWPKYLVEILVIFFSITVSFAVDEWKDNAQKRALEQTYLKGLAANLAVDRNQLREVIAETDSIVQKARRLIRVSQQKNAPGTDYVQVVNDVRFMFKRPRFIAEDATFADLRSSGNMHLLGDFELKGALFDYYKDYESTQQVESAERDVTINLTAPYLVRRLPLSNRPVANGKFHHEADLLVLLSEVEFQNNMYIRQSTREELLGDYKSILEQCEAIQARLKQRIR